MASCDILPNSFEEQWTENYPAEYLSGLSRALFLTIFLKIAVNSDYFGSSVLFCVVVKPSIVTGFFAVGSQKYPTFFYHNRDSLASDTELLWPHVTFIKKEK